MPSNLPHAQVSHRDGDYLHGILLEIVWVLCQIPAGPRRPQIKNDSSTDSLRLHIFAPQGKVRGQHFEIGPRIPVKISKLDRISGG